MLAHNFRNAYELAVDSFGDLWQNDNDDQVMTCRTTWLMEGANAGYFSPDGSRYWQADRRPGQDTFTAHWHQEDPGVLPAGDNTGAGAPSGIVRHEGDQLGARYRGLLLSADAGRNVVFGYLPKAQGAGFALERSDFLSSLAAPNENYIWNKVEQDERKWFRPSDVAVGADGAIYVADWYDPIVGGHQMQDGKGYGRIYRITPKGRTLTTPSIDLQYDGRSNSGAAQPGSQRAQQRLRAAQGTGRRGAPRSEAASLPIPIRIIARARSGCWPQLGPAGVREVERLLADDDPQIRIAAFRALRKVKPSVLDEARRLSEDPSPAVRREVALALRGAAIHGEPRHSPEARRRIRRRAIAGIWKRWARLRPGIEAAVYSALLPALGHPDPMLWDARFSAIAWRLHPTMAVDAFKARAASAPASGGRATTGAGRAGLHQRSARRAGDGRADAQRAA